MHTYLGVNIQPQKFDHALTLKMTSKMRDDIDKALVLVQDTFIRSRSEFLRAACQYMLDSLARGSGDVPVSIAERKERVLAGADGLEVVKAPVL
jgi:Arc/MetJ-type ribon-helix-helix transcriptional regulator